MLKDIYFKFQHSQKKLEF